MNKRIIVVANRLPVSVCQAEEGISYKASPGGLVTALSSLKDKYEQLWIGWPGEVDLELLDASEITTKLKTDFKAIPIFLNKQQINRYYFGFSNKVLWPILHYLPGHCDYDERDWKMYKQVNEIFAEKVLKQLDDDQYENWIWIHDYQLLLVPALVREKRPNAKIGFFLHTPFPTSEIVRAVPYRNELLKGILGASLIGFHTYGYLRHFRSSLLRILGINSEINRVDLETHSAKLGVYPISIDTAKIQETVNSNKIQEYTQIVQQITQKRKLIISVDRLDYTKGIANRLKGFKKFLERNPRYASQTVLVQIAVPSRTQITSYRELKEEVEEIVSEINEIYEKEKNPPIHYIYRSLPFEKLAAFYKAAEICLVTPLCDGMNLVAKEYVAVQKDKGVLILSEFAGAASELGEAMVINPWNPDQIADAIEQAFNMPFWERSRRMNALFTKVARNDVHYWANSFLADLEEPASVLVSSATEPLSLSMRDEILGKYHQAESALIVSDYDGTLVEITNVPINAKPDRNLLSLLEKLTQKPNTDIVISSGRSKTDMLDWLDNTGVGLSVEHGLWIKFPDENKWHKTLTDEQLPVWYESVKEILAKFCRGTPGSFIEEKETSLVWHYRLSDPEFGNWQARELTLNLTNFLANKPAEVLSGKRIVEVRIAGINKGNIFSRIQQLNKKYDFILMLGDDSTDEDLFAAAPDYAYSIKIGNNISKAKYRLNRVSDVRDFLSRFV
jgi:trehalose 6-phosphate synthase/phosphatase